MYKTRKNYLYDGELYIIGLDDTDCFVYRRLQWQPVDLGFVEEIKANGLSITIIQAFEVISDHFRREAAV